MSKINQHANAQQSNQKPNEQNNKLIDIESNIQSWHNILIYMSYTCIFLIVCTIIFIPLEKYKDDNEIEESSGYNDANFIVFLLIIPIWLIFFTKPSDYSKLTRNRISNINNNYIKTEKGLDKGVKYTLDGNWPYIITTAIVASFVLCFYFFYYFGSEKCEPGSYEKNEGYRHMIPVLFCDFFTDSFVQSAITILFFVQLFMVSYYTFMAGKMQTRNMHEQKAKQLKKNTIEKAKQLSTQGMKLASKSKKIVSKQIKKLKSKPDIPVEVQALPVNKTGSNKPPPVVQGTLVVKGATPVQKKKGFFDRFFRTKND